MSDRAGFDDFFKRYVAAVRKGDKAFLKGTLPPSIGEDHLDFLLQTNKAMFDQFEAEGIQPAVSEQKGRIELTYSMKSEDGEETMTRPFWWHEGRWVSYDPENPGA
jgi:hypothetical protein